MDDIERKLRELGERMSEEPGPAYVGRGRIVGRVRRRRAATVAGSVATVVLLAAVAYPALQRETPRPPFDLATVARATEEAGTARIEIDMEVRAGDQTTTLRATGEADFEARRSHVRLEPTGALGEGDVEMITVGDTIFQRTLGNPQWVKDEVESTGGADIYSGGPDALLATLELHADEVTKRGTEIRDGVEVTHLRADIDEGAATGSPMANLIRYEPIDLWVDGQNRVREIAMVFSFEGTTPDAGQTTNVTMRLWDFGLPVEIEAPDSEDVSTPTPRPEPGEPTPPPTHVTGGGTDEPYVVLEPGHPTQVCVHFLWEQQGRAVLVDEVSGETIFSAMPNGAAATVGRSEALACATESVDQADLDRLVRRPRRFTLRVEREGPDAIVRLIDARQQPAPLIELEKKSD